VCWLRLEPLALERPPPDRRLLGPGTATSSPSTDAASCAWAEGLLRPPPPRRLRDELLFGGGTGGAGIEMDLGVGTGVSSCGGLGTVGRSEVVDADRVRLIDAASSEARFRFFLVAGLGICSSPSACPLTLPLMGLGGDCADVVTAASAALFSTMRAIISSYAASRLFIVFRRFWGFW